MRNRMTKEGRLRKPHFREWPHFLGRLIPDQTWRGLDGPASERQNDRNRWSPKLVILCWVMMGWSVQGALTERFREGRQMLARMFYRRRRSGKSFQGLTQATDRIDVDLFQRFWRRLRSTIPQRSGEAWTWRGWRVFAVDGSRVAAPRTRSNQKALGKSGKDKSHPQWWITRLIHLPTRLMWDWRQGPGNSSERDHLTAMLGSLPQGSLLVGDIGFGGFDFLAGLREAGQCFLIRCGGNTRLLIEQTHQRIERLGDVRFVYLWPANRRRHSPLRLRLIIHKQGPQRRYLLTNVLEPTRLSRATAGVFYKARWDIEVEYRGFKQTMGHRKLLGRTAAVGGMELAANMVAMALLMLYAAMVLGAKMTQFSLAAALRVIRHAIEALRHRQSCQWLTRQLRQAVKDDYQRRRSKQARNWPHKKNDPPPGPPKLRMLTKKEKTRIRELYEPKQSNPA